MTQSWSAGCSARVGRDNPFAGPMVLVPDHDQQSGDQFRHTANFCGAIRPLVPVMKLLVAVVKRGVAVGSVANADHMAGTSSSCRAPGTAEAASGRGVLIHHVKECRPDSLEVHRFSGGPTRRKYSRNLPVPTNTQNQPSSK